MNFVSAICFWVIGGFVLYCIITVAVKKAIEDTLFDFRKDLLTDLKEIMEENKNNQG